MCFGKKIQCLYRIFVIFSGAIALSMFQPAIGQSPNPDPNASLTRKLDSILITRPYSGFVVGIVTKDTVLYQKGFGTADIKSNKPYTIHTLQNIGSVSKTLIGIALMQLVEAGKLSLDSPVDELQTLKIQNPRNPTARPGIRHLATHTAGIRDSKIYNKLAYVPLTGLPANLNTYSGREKKLLRQAEATPIYTLQAVLSEYLVASEKGNHHKKNFNAHPPGTHYEYSNMGATLAAYAVEQLSGMEYKTYTQTHILAPLGMQESGWEPTKFPLAQRATLYFASGRVVPPYRLNTYPDGGLVTSCHDMCRYMQALLKVWHGESDFLKKSSLDTLWAIHHQDESVRSGIFWDISRQGNIGHNGADPGVFTCLQLSKDKTYGFYFATNCSIFEQKEGIQYFIQIWRAIKAHAPELK